MEYKFVLSTKITIREFQITWSTQFHGLEKFNNKNKSHFSVVKLKQGKNVKESYLPIENQTYSAIYC